MSERMKWLLLSMLLALSRGSDCSNSGNCSYQELSYKYWKIRCPSDTNPKFTARFNVRARKYRVECHDATSLSEFEYQPTFPLAVPRFVAIERCPLPDSFSDHIVQRLGFHLAQYLTFTSHMNLSSTLTRRHFSMLSDLVSLNLSSNGLTELPSDLFRDLGKLNELDLSFNEIAMLPHDIFHSLELLKKISMSHNAMKFVDWRLFGNCTKLYELSLRRNLLTNLDHRTFRDINKRNIIDIADNLLETLPPDAFEYSEGLMLDISGNRFSTLPEELISWTGLTELTLDLNRGNLTTLPMNFLSNLTKLDKVILIRSSLTSLPEQIFWGSFSVQSIDLHGNALSTLPKNIFRDSRALTFLDLSDNGLTYVPEGLFRALSELRQLNLAGNSIASLSENMFGNLSSLLELDLGFNKITNIHVNTFRELPNIRVIRLSHNSVNITELNVVVVKEYFYAPTIQKLFLDHNSLTDWVYIEGADDEIPMNLRLVDLSYNEITEVSVTSPLMGSVDVEYDLRHNNLSNIHIWDEISSKVNILVDDNPLDCGCTMYTLLKYMHEIREAQFEENFEIILGNASCGQPYWMIDTPVASLRLETFICRPDDVHRNVRCAEGCVCWWRPHDRTRIVDCSSKNFEEMPDETVGFVVGDEIEEYWVLRNYVDGRTAWVDWPNTRVELDLANNSLTEIPRLNVSAYKYVETLTLSHNKISKLSFDVLPPRIKTLHLDHNDLVRFDRVAWNVVMNSASLRKINFEGNQWGCDSDTRKCLRMMEDKFGSNLQYSFGTCLDFRNPPNTKDAPEIYISYTTF